jgi:effector-binding domain-containing protein
LTIFSKGMAMQPAQPSIEVRQEQLYVAISRRVSMEEMASTIPPLLGDVFGWLGKQGIAPAGPPFFRYVVLNMPGDMVVAAGVPIDAAVAGEGDIEPGTIPAGRYVTAMHTGHPAELEEATGKLLEWADAHDVTWPMHHEADGEHWDAPGSSSISIHPRSSRT